MRIRMNINQPNPERFIEQVMEKYHFSTNEKQELADIYNKIMECIKPYAAYRINRRVTGIKQIDDSQAAIVSMRLGIGLDELKDDYTKKGEIDKAYMLDCITNELLMKMYVEFNNMYAKYHRRYVKRYVFIGDEISTEKIPELLQEIKETDKALQNKKTDDEINDDLMLYNEEIGTMELSGSDLGKKSDKEITANKYGVLTPAKSVVFYAILTENPAQICEGICENCNNKSCENNPFYVEEDDKTNYS
ncbi:MAG: hypothetical protein IJ167_05155 [Lachnospiraceae bacterium]|nr:hypothetical protein [Lachnospiraceae bacterium]